jgi:hypothetical protein
VATAEGVVIKPAAVVAPEALGKKPRRCRRRATHATTGWRASGRTASNRLRSRTADDVRLPAEGVHRDVGSVVRWCRPRLQAGVAEATARPARVLERSTYRVRVAANPPAFIQPTAKVRRVLFGPRRARPRAVLRLRGRTGCSAPGGLPQIRPLAGSALQHRVRINAWAPGCARPALDGPGVRPGRRRCHSKTIASAAEQATREWGGAIRQRFQ